MVRWYFRGDAAFACPGIYAYLEEHGFLYAIRLPSNDVLDSVQGRGQVLLTTTDLHSFPSSFLEEASIFRIAQGQVGIEKER